MLVAGRSGYLQFHFCINNPGDTNLLYEVGVTGGIDKISVPQAHGFNRGLGTYT